MIATGASHAYFGHDEWAAHDPGLKSIEDATEIRRRILLAFERAEMEADPAERHRLLTFVIVGGGPTGVEMAGTLAELARKALSTDFRVIDPAKRGSCSSRRARASCPASRSACPSMRAARSSGSGWR